MEARTETAAGVGGALGRLPGWALAAGALALIAAALVALALAGEDALPERTGPPVEELAVERAVLEPNRIELSLRNPGPRPGRDLPGVRERRVCRLRGRRDANRPAGPARRSRWHTRGRTVRPYIVSLVTSTGVVIEHEIPAAVETPAADGDFSG